MTATEIQDESRYRYEERLGLLCGDGVPTSAEQAIAKADAEAWLASIETENIPEFPAGIGRSSRRGL